MAQISKKYRFAPFYHVYADELLEQFNRFGVDGVLKPKANNNDGGEILFKQKGFPDNQQFDFEGEYIPHSKNVLGPYPNEDFDFSARGAYSTYNWEIFYHNPILAAERLSQNQKFEEAQNWYHNIFDPTISFDAKNYPELEDTNLSETEKADLENRLKNSRFWRLKPFHDFVSKKSIERLLTALSANPNDPEVSNLSDSISVWEKNPFQPHILAQMRVVSYMKYTLMKYLDNLIAWGDSLFRQDSMESINEATQLYLLAASILGDRPQAISRKDASSQSYEDLISTGKFDEFSNKLIQLENGIVGSPIKRGEDSAANNNGLASINALFFCIPSNKKMEGYWDTIADRLFKIRNCQNIDGVERQLALFAPPLDPLALVKAAGSGGSYLEAIRSLNAPLSAYRFRYMVQRAIELCNEVKGLGGALLSALEKKDAEVIAGIRNQHEIKVLDNLRYAKKLAVEEATQTIETLVESKANANHRLNFYQSRQYMNKEEATQLSKLKAAMDMENGANATELVLGTLGAIPQISTGANGAFGTPHFAIKIGGKEISSLANGGLKFTRALASMERSKANQLSIKAGHKRRKEDWDFQAQTAAIELKQIDKQIEGAYHRREIALYELELNEKQLANAQEISEVMETKFTNKELYSWMITEISSLYFKGYQLALDVAKVAERCYQFERFDNTATFIDPLNWNSLKKGLLAGERLSDNIRQMQHSYDQTNQRKLEIKKNISLHSIDADAILNLRQTGICHFDIPEVLFDLDFPGHIRRRIKSVSISIPCVVGPNGNVPAKLTLGNNLVRVNTQDATVSKYPRTSNDERFKIGRSTSQSIATSTANRDAGLFELNFNDERYLPFEGAGVISSWTLELPDPELAQFDYDTISDVIVHINYEAEEGGIRTAVTDYLKENMEQVLMQNGSDSRDWVQVISLKEQFSSELISLMGNTSTDLHITKMYFPFLVRSRTLNIQSLELQIIPKEGVDWSPAPDSTFNFDDGTNTPSISVSLTNGILGGSITGSGSPLSLNIDEMTVTKADGSTDLVLDEVKDILVIIGYQIADIPSS